MKESTLSANIVRAINALPYAHAQKMHGGGFSRTGTPDIIACVGGKMLVIEVKTATGHLAPAQFVELKRWAQAGARGAVITSVEGALRAVEMLQGSDETTLAILGENECDRN